eukprot:CAMPEP_0201598260 /NCGR_PEP_ID=MMETSP0492-20130828/88_1 /ASSEMBLY_ACC=CAM_ASM_000837 /TAXON_ID=420259 /ORGANISM="Thalassiosira gravida, Strain GMp14c1" /LENGTH=144 /DNA_ID=CAMNT_0048060641 /DNA_START=108 /DNA_END=542 /DNA_ORIENTATION=-
MKVYASTLLTATFAIIANTAALTSAFSITSRKAFLSEVSRAGGAAVVAATVATSSPEIASARDGVAQRLLKQKAAEKKARSEPKKSSGGGGGGGGDDDGPSMSKAGSNDTFRGGKEEADKINLGTELDKGQAQVADGLMGKLGL